MILVLVAFDNLADGGIQEQEAETAIGRSRFSQVVQIRLSMASLMSGSTWMTRFPNAFPTTIISLGRMARFYGLQCAPEVSITDEIAKINGFNLYLFNPSILKNEPTTPFFIGNCFRYWPGHQLDRLSNVRI